MNKILIVDDEESIRKVLGLFLKKQGYKVSSAEKLSETYSILKKQDFDLILLDINLPDGNSLEFMKKIKELNNNSSIITMTAQDTMNNAIEAIKNGAYDYIRKPFDFNEDFSLTIDRAIKNSIKNNQISKLEKNLSRTKSNDFEMIGKSIEIKKIFKDIGRIAESNHTVLIMGESGTGKELVSKAIQSSGKNSNKPYVQVNITAIPNELLESELFGYEKGAFTGADKKKIGRFEEANGGTILLDEIGDMSYDLQSKILRVLEEKKFYRLGSQKPVEFDCRIIASTNKDLEREIKKKRFREDLYFRLNSISIELPNLRERKSDIPLLIESFLAKYKNNNDQLKIIDEEFLKVFLDYDWPGNIRELENSIKKLVLMVPDSELTIDSVKSHLPKILKNFETRENTINFNKLIQNLFNNSKLPEKNLYNFIIQKIDKALIQSIILKEKGDIKKASVTLGLNKKELIKKIEELDISQLLDSDT